MRYIVTLSVLLLSCFILAINGMAAENTNTEKIRDAMQAYHDGDTQKAIKILKPLAEKGDAVAQSKLGSIYGGDSEADALKWFTLAARQGDAHAQINMGDLYLSGYAGLKQDYKEAMKYYTMAAEQGDPDAQISIGLLYQYGNGVPKDINEAVRWYKKAAQKDLVAYTYLGDMYRMGNGVKQDMNEAVRYYLLAAEGGDKYQQKNLGDIYSGGNFLYGDQYKDVDRAIKWYTAAAKNGNGDAQVSLAAMYYNGKVIPKDTMMAYIWYMISLNTNSTNSTVVNIITKLESGMSAADIAKAKNKMSELMKEIKPTQDKDNSWRPFSY